MPPADAIVALIAWSMFERPRGQKPICLSHKSVSVVPLDTCPFSRTWYCPCSRSTSYSIRLQDKVFELTLGVDTNIHADADEDLAVSGRRCGLRERLVGALHRAVDEV